MPLGSRGLAALFLLLSSTHAAVAAVSIQYSVVPLGGNVYKYTYSITNGSGGSAVQLFDILFDTSLYQESSLQIVTPAPLSAQWTQQILHSVPPSIPASYTALALVGGIPAGSTVSGFSVQFTWLGSGVPGAQPFQIFDPGTFALLESGTSAPAPLSVPTASTLSLALLGVALAAASVYQARQRVSEASLSHSPESW